MDRLKPDGDATIFARAYRQTVIAVLEKISDRDIARVIEILDKARASQRQIFICGNGGSATTGSHFAAGLGNEASRNGTRFRVISLADNVPWLTAIANDDDYSAVFVAQLRNFAQPSDVLIAISGSGNSPNVVRAVEWANAHGLATIGITSHPGGALATLAQHTVRVEATHIAQVEEAHFLIQHLVTYYFAHRDEADMRRAGSSAETVAASRAVAVGSE